LKSATTFLSGSIEKGFSIEEYTKQFILVYQNKYNEKKLATMLGITRKSLWEKRKRWGISRLQM
jgi:two-component system response regulator PilR (NtrC family)